MKKIYLLMLLLSAAVGAQTFEWIQTPPITFSMNPDMVSYTTACDPEGNVYFVGYKEGAYPYNEIMGNLYYNKYNAAGNLLFSKTIIGKAFAYNVVSDSEGNIVMALGYIDTMDLGDETITAPNDSMQYLLVKFDVSGALLWHKHITMVVNGMDYVADMRAVTIDSDDNIYAGYDNFGISRITKYTPDGTELMTLEQQNVGRITSIDVDDTGNIYAAGSCAGGETATFQGIVAPSGLQYSTYVVKYSPAGIYQWVKFVEDVTCSEAHVVARSENEVYYSSGLFGAYMFDGFQAEGPVESGGDFFLAKISAEGAYQWVREVPGPGAVGLGRSKFLEIDNQGYVYLCGYSDGTINWGNGMQTVVGVRESIVLKYTPDGEVEMAVTAASGGYGRADAVSVNNGNAYLAGMGFANGVFGDIEYNGAQDEYYTYLTKVSLSSLGSADFQKSEVTLYPNPATNFIYFTGNDEIKGSIYNVLGQKISDVVAAPSSPVDVSYLPSGSYYLMIDGARSFKFIKQ